MEKNIYTKKGGEYFKNNPSWHVKDSAWKAKHIIKILKKNSIAPSDIADIGCGAGEILNQLHQHMPKDTSFIGYDISPDAISFAKEREKERLQFRNEDFLKIDS